MRGRTYAHARARDGVRWRSLHLPKRATMANGGWWKHPNFHFIQVGVANGNVWMKSHRFKTDRITIPLDHTFNSSKEQAWTFLERIGYEFKGAGEWDDSYVLASTTFEPLREMVKRAKGSARAKR